MFIVKLIIFIPVLFIAAAFAGCNEIPNEPVNRLLVNTGYDSYTGITIITATLKNETPYTIYLPQCSAQIGVYIQRKQNSMWITDNARGMDCKEKLSNNFFILNSKSEKKDSIIFINQSGLYRLKYIYSYQKPPIFSDSVFSNEFNYSNPR